MSFSALNWVTGGRLRLQAAAGVQWDASTHYWALIKNAHTPSASDTQYSNISANICTSNSYAHKNVASKTLAESGGVVTYDCADPDFSNGGANPMVGRYMYLLEGDYSAPNAADKILGYIDLNNGGATDVNVNAAVTMHANGLLTST